MFPHWLHNLSIGMLVVGLVCTFVVLIDVVRHPQHMAIMNIVGREIS